MAIQLPLSHLQFGRKGISEEGEGKRRKGKNRRKKRREGMFLLFKGTNPEVAHVTSAYILLART